MSGIKISVILLFLLLLPLISKAQEPFKVMFYNVENLYDTINNPHTNDDDLTPEGNLHWTSYRYHKKLEDISKVISSLGGKYPPAIVGLCEVENKMVMNDLTQSSSLARHKYRYTMTNSKDLRGSNVVLMYQRDQFRLISKRSYTPKIDKETQRSTRDILHIVGEVVSGDTLDFFVCHYPSRSEGVAKSQPYRIEVSRLLKQKIDSLKKKRKQANIIVMGDFNDYPNDVSIRETLEANNLDAGIDTQKLYNLFSENRNASIASYKYRGKWGYLDQFIVSGNLFNAKGDVYIIDQKASVYDAEFLLDYDEKYGGKKPFRTFSGWKYLGGISDHLPIYLDLYIKE